MNDRLRKTILVTGGAGYIGRHVALALASSGYAPIILDDLRVTTLLPEKLNGMTFLRGDIGDVAFLDAAFEQHHPFAVVHLAASTEVNDSVKFPDKYWKNNTLNTNRILSAMHRHGCRNILFSSTAAVYGEPLDMNRALTESDRPAPVNPYGESKLAAEELIANFPGINAVIFRYFNVVGYPEAYTHHNMLFPRLLRVLSGYETTFTIFGNTYDTKDGTCVRDLIHVDAIADAHVKALASIASQTTKVDTFNIGSGSGYSVGEVIAEARKLVDFEVRYGEPRAGDPKAIFASNEKISRGLGVGIAPLDLARLVREHFDFARSDRYRIPGDHV